MTIGQVTISAADWLASRVTDRVALMAAGQRTVLSQQAGSEPVQPAQEDVGAQMERRQRERAILTAQENYRRVAERIKARLRENGAADPATAARPKEGDATQPRAKEAALDPVRSAAVLTRSAQADEAVRTGLPGRPEPVMGMIELEQKKTSEALAKKDASDAASAADRDDDDRLVFTRGRWADLFAVDDRTVIVDLSA